MMMDELPPLTIPASLRNHLTQTRDEFIDLVSRNIDFLRRRGFSDIGEDISLVRNNQEEVIRYQPLQETYELCRAIELLNNISKYPAPPRDVSNQAIMATDILALIAMGKASKIMNAGNAVPQQEGGDADLSLAHLVREHAPDLIGLAEQVARALPASDPTRRTLFKELADLRVSNDLPPMG